MLKLQFFIALFLISYCVKAQDVKISGNIKDTITGLDIPQALVMATKFSDSTLVSYARSNANGKFTLNIKTADTLLLITSANNFSDQYVLFIPAKDKFDYNLGEIILPPQTIEIKEIVIKAYTDPVYFKGDTLVFLADSFKVRQNATVEDLLKKLPGVKVDNAGKVTVQGKSVDKVLVDGDEFFGKDPSIALKNLGADAVESVQVYDKKAQENNNASGEENEKILDLKLKDSAKKGYFGKVSAGSDAQKFYEGELLFNRFTGNNKVSVFYKGGNTPNTQFDWEDINQYGLSNEYMFLNEDGEWSGNMNTMGDGLPNNHKAGFYVNQNISKKTKINANYAFGFSSLLKQTKTTSQYYFNDSSFTKKSDENALNKLLSHKFNIEFEQKLDSLTDLRIFNRVDKSDGNVSNVLEENFINSENSQFRTTKTNDVNSSNSLKYELQVDLEKKLNKKDRTLISNYFFNLNEYNAGTDFNQENIFYGEYSNLNKAQKSKEDNASGSHALSVRYNEPLTKKLNYNVQLKGGFSNESKSRNVDDEDVYGNYTNNLFYTNSFRTLRTTATLSNTLHYSTKKIGVRGGADIRSLNLDNVNLITDYTIKQSALNVLPFASFRYTFGSNSSFHVSYRMNTKLPNIRYIQPVPSNLNTNELTIGNPNIKQSVTNNINANLWMYKAISNFYYGLSSNFTHKQNDFVINTTYDSLGRSINRWENTNGNYSASLNGWLNKPFYKKIFAVGSNINVVQNLNNNFINGVKNTTQNNNYNINGDLTFTKEIIELKVNGGYSYNFSKSTLYNSINVPYTSYSAGGSCVVYIGDKAEIASEATYTVNSKRNNGYNLNLLIWNARMTYNFLKEKNLNLSLVAYDILNNQISLNRYAYGNVVSDTKTNIVARYFTVNLTYRFKNKGKESKDEVFVE